MTHSRSALALLVLTLAGCGGPAPDVDAGTDSAVGDAGYDAGHDGGTDAGPEIAPIFRNEVTLPDDELAMQALRLMGAPEAGGSASCSECHAITRPNIARFRMISDTAWTTCLADLALETPAAATAAVECFRAGGLYSATKLGVFSTGAYFEWFEYAFRKGIPRGWTNELSYFRQRVGMPPAGHPALTQAEFDLLTEWFLRGTPLVDTILPPADGPGDCTSYVGADVAGLVADGEATGWSARNVDASILMHGCAGAATPLDCLSTYPRASETTYGAQWETAGTHLRVLFDANYNTSYWTKTSADGRFVAHGGNPDGAGASIIDLQRGVVIGASAAYDPGFFPDNSGFMFQGTSRGASVCHQSVLTTGNPTLINFNEPGCSGADIALYQHVGASLDGGDYWAVNSLWSGDPGGGTNDPDVFVDENAEASFIRLINTASGYTQGATSTAPTPWEGNAVLSPTFRMLATQLSTAAGGPLGYVLRRLNVTRNATGVVTGVEAPEIARYCFPGGKAALSLDDRWLVTHHRADESDAVDLGFTGPDDPGFAAYRGVSNIYLIDLLSGTRTRITNMQPGQRALFPSFRSDGWIYFLVRSASRPERIVASDAALVLR